MYPCLSKEDISVSLVRPAGFQAGHLDVITVTLLSLAKKARLCVPEVQRVLELRALLARA